MASRVYRINAALFVLAEIGIAIFDATLQLGQLQGAVFALWTLYLGALFLLVNGVIAAVRAVRGEPARPFVISAAVVPIVAIILAWATSAIMS